MLLSKVRHQVGAVSSRGTRSADLFAHLATRIHVTELDIWYKFAWSLDGTLPVVQVIKLPGRCPTRRSNASGAVPVHPLDPSLRRR